jgi:uncharacterized protein (DUF2236 family)
MIGPDRPDVEGLYGPASEAWRLNREAAMLMVAGPRALLLQVAHPLVAAGVDEHSDFRTDPWRRLEGTIRSYLAIVYGTRDQALAEIARLNGLHREIRGDVHDPDVARRFGDRYEARDPELSLWVHATLVDSTIVAYDLLVEPLSPERRARFYAETRPIARLFGVPEEAIPADYPAFASYLGASVGPAGPVHPTDASREIAWQILHPPFGPIHPALGWIPRRASTWTFWPAVAALPSTTRAEYRLELGPVERVVAGWLIAAWRAWRPRLPEAFRQMAAARRADARIARVRGVEPSRSDSASDAILPA